MQRCYKLKKSRVYMDILEHIAHVRDKVYGFYYAAGADSKRLWKKEKKPSIEFYQHTKLKNI